MLIEEEEDRVTLLSQVDTAIRMQQGQKNLYEINIGYVNSSRTDISPKILEKLTKIKFLRGDSSFLTDELNFLREWIKVSGPQKMYDLYTKHILKGKVFLERDYQNSPLQKLFHTLMGTKV
jgi:hypothetical protein